jgi:hypothetical protein
MAVFFRSASCLPLWQEPYEDKNVAMTGFLLFVLIVAAIALGLEVNHRRVRRQFPYVVGTADADLRRVQHDLATLA